MSRGFSFLPSPSSLSQLFIRYFSKEKNDLSLMGFCSWKWRRRRKWSFWVGRTAIVFLLSLFSRRNSLPLSLCVAVVWLVCCLSFSYHQARKEKMNDLFVAHHWKKERGKVLYTHDKSSYWKRLGKECGGTKKEEESRARGFLSFFRRTSHYLLTMPG